MTRLELKELKENFMRVGGRRFKYGWNGCYIGVASGILEHSPYGLRTAITNDQGYEVKIFADEISPNYVFEKGDELTFAGYDITYVFMNYLRSGNLSVLRKGEKKGRTWHRPESVTSINGKTPYPMSPILDKLYGLVK